VGPITSKSSAWGNGPLQSFSDDKGVLPSSQLALTRLHGLPSLPLPIDETYVLTPYDQQTLSGTDRNPLDHRAAQQPGAYWYKRDPPFRDIMVNVRVTDGELTVWWPNSDQPVGNLKRHWRDPIPHQAGQGAVNRPIDE